MEKLKFIFRYIQYFFTAKGKMFIHSPFVFDLYTKVILSKKDFYAFDQILAIRKMLLKNETKIKVSDFGAGSHINNDNEKSIKSIAKNAAKSDRIGQLLFKLLDHIQPKNALELGTSLGISTLYQCLASKNTKWTTMEGCPETAKVAQKIFASVKAENVKVVVGDFALTLPETVASYTTLDYIFFDGNHRKQPTLDYFKICLEKVNEGSLFIFDDIHWSAEMEEAWEEIKNHPQVTVTIDLFWIGLVFFKKNQEKEHFVLKF